MSKSDKRSYPRRVATEAGEVEFRHMTAADEAAVLAFAKKLPAHDLLFIPRDISEPKVLSAWIKEIERGGQSGVGVPAKAALAAVRKSVAQPATSRTSR